MHYSVTCGMTNSRPRVLPLFYKRCTVNWALLTELLCYLFQQTDIASAEAGGATTSPLATSPTTVVGGAGAKRLHVSNIPFKFREQDLRQLMGVSMMLYVCKSCHLVMCSSRQTWRKTPRRHLLVEWRRQQAVIPQQDPSGYIYPTSHSDSEK